MKKLITIAAVLSLVSTATLQTGCTTAGSAAVSDARKLGEAYYKQPNVAEFLRIGGTNLSFTVSGASLVSLGAPVPPKQIIPREESWVHSTADVLKTVAPVDLHGLSLPLHRPRQWQHQLDCYKQHNPLKKNPCPASVIIARTSTSGQRCLSWTRHNPEGTRRNGP